MWGQSSQRLEKLCNTQKKQLVEHEARNVN